MTFTVRFERHGEGATPRFLATWVVGSTACLTAAVAALVCIVAVARIHPWDGSIGRAFALAIVVSIVAPLGDLCESLVKRDLAVKDMGSSLPGHGGFLDRFDAMLFVLPATYYLVAVLELG